MCRLPGMPTRESARQHGARRARTYLLCRVGEDARAREIRRGVEHSTGRIDGRRLPHPHSEDRVRAGPAHRLGSHRLGSRRSLAMSLASASIRWRHRSVTRPTLGSLADSPRGSHRHQVGGRKSLCPSQAIVEAPTVSLLPADFDRRSSRRRPGSTTSRPRSGDSEGSSATSTRSERILLVSDTRHNRMVIDQVPELRRQFPVDTRQCLAALGRGLDPQAAIAWSIRATVECARRTPPVQ